MHEQPDYTTMSDPDFLAERRRVREQLERMPKQDPKRAALAATYAALTREFLARAGRAWRAAS